MTDSTAATQDTKRSGFCLGNGHCRYLSIISPAPWPGKRLQMKVIAVLLLKIKRMGLAGRVILSYLWYFR